MIDLQVILFNRHLTPLCVFLSIDSYWWVLGFLIITVLFFYQVMR